MASAAPQRRPIVLVVEDEPIIRMDAVAMVEDAGFEVIEAANADEAIAILESRDDIRAIFTDIDMPGSMDGIKLSHAVSNRWPPIRIFVTSGVSWPNATLLPPGGQFIPKPYAPTQIASALSSLK